MMDSKKKFDVAVLGGGPAGYTAAETLGKAGLSVVLFDGLFMLGGTCVNVGCIPTKALLYSAKVYRLAKTAAKYGVNIPEEIDEPSFDLKGYDVTETVTFDTDRAQVRKEKIVRKLIMGIENRLRKCGVEIHPGTADIIDRNTLKYLDRLFTFDKLFICTGAKAIIPPIKGLKPTMYWTNYEALDNVIQPDSMVVAGGGVVGLELAAYFSTIGTQVTVIEMGDEILPGMDRELAGLLRAEYTRRGMKFILNAKVISLVRRETHVAVFYKTGEEQKSITVARLLICAGRTPEITGFGLEKLNVELVDDRAIRVNKHMETSVPGVYACGDVTGFSMLAHTAVREAEVAAHHVLGKPDEMDYRAIPLVVNTDPELAGVGQTEEELKAAGTEYELVKLPLSYSGRFLTDNEGFNGYCKLLLSKGDRRVLGAHVLGNPASEIITLAGMAITYNLTAEEWKKTIFPHPSVGEIFREAL
jgi:dihydrolipoamide dehydrogenase